MCYSQRLGENLCIDESTDQKNIGQLVIFVKGMDNELNATEKLLSLQPIKDTTTDDICTDLFNTFKNLGMDLSTLCEIATYAA